MNDTILVIHYHSGIVTYIPKDKTALDIIISKFDYIEEVIEVDIDPHAKKRTDKIAHLALEVCNALDQDTSVHRLSEETQGAYADLCEAREAIISS